MCIRPNCNKPSTKNTGALCYDCSQSKPTYQCKYCNTTTFNWFAICGVCRPHSKLIQRMIQQIKALIKL
jgi:hypothetical protein